MQFKKIYIEITNICNKNCSFCSKSLRNKKEMTLEEFSNVINEVKKYTNYIYLHVKGEPLLHSSFADIIDICDKNNMKVNITTNGTFLSKYKEKIISSSSIRQINISLHSYNNVNDLIELMNAVDYINNNSNIYLVYRYWILKQSMILENNIIFNKLFEYYNLNEEEKNEIVFKQNIKLKSNLYINKDFEFVWPSLNNNYCEKIGFCLGLKSHIAILSDGTVVPCCLDADGVINLGNIFKTDLEIILSSERTTNIINNFKNNKKVEELCQHCSFNH